MRLALRDLSFWFSLTDVNLSQLDIPAPLYLLTTDGDISAALTAPIFLNILLWFSQTSLIPL